jgi:hypothetical protein
MFDLTHSSARVPPTLGLGKIDPSYTILGISDYAADVKVKQNTKKQKHLRLPGRRQGKKNKMKNDKNLRRRNLLVSPSDNSLKELQINNVKDRQKQQGIKYEEPLTRDQVSMEFREQYIIRGYRPPNSTILM